MSNNDITRCDRKFILVWSQLLQFEAVRTSSQQGHRLSCPAERERSAAKDRGTEGQYVAVFVQSPNHLWHITHSQPFRIKCEKYIFLKKRVRSSLLLILLRHAYVYVRHIQYTLENWPSIFSGILYIYTGSEIILKCYWFNIVNCLCLQSRPPYYLGIFFKSFQQSRCLNLLNIAITFAFSSAFVWHKVLLVSPSFFPHVVI